MDLRLELGFMMYLAINIVSTSRVNINLAFIVKIPFSNSIEASKVR